MSRDGQTHRVRKSYPSSDDFEDLTSPKVKPAVDKGRTDNSYSAIFDSYNGGPSNSPNKAANTSALPPPRTTSNKQRALVGGSPQLGSPTPYAESGLLSPKLNQSPKIGSNTTNPYWGSPNSPGQRAANASGVGFLENNSADDLSSNDHTYGGKPHPWHQSLTPSMSASNVGPTDANGEKDWKTLQAANEKLLSSKDKYDGQLHPSILKNLGPEEDDDLHDPGPPLPRKGADRLIVDTKKIAKQSGFSSRGFWNILGVFILAAALFTIFAGLPLVDYFTTRSLGITSSARFGDTSTNSTGQSGTVNGNGLIDTDTPKSAYETTDIEGNNMVLVFSDEFNKDGRTFYPGDDPFWEAMDFYYHVTRDLEMYNPDQATTKDGHLVLQMNVTDPDLNGDLGYRSAMLQSWNKFCFTGGRIEANVSLPGTYDIPGFWPALWTMGNIGRAGFAASTDGTWPYSYDTCDVGTLANQSYFGRPNEPAAAHIGGDPVEDGELSFLPGQKLSACTCPGEDHPGPMRSDGRFKGRAAPEIDALEAMTHRISGGESSQSLQVAPFDANYTIDNITAGYTTFFPDSGFQTVLNEYQGAVYQQAVSGLSRVPNTAFDGGWMTVGFEYTPSDHGDGEITWYMNGLPTWRVRAGAVGPNPLVDISQRLIPNEPMYIIMNFGMSPGFGEVDEANLPFPSEYKIDYVRVWQKPDHIDYGCDGMKGDYPTTEYINNHLEAYMNKNRTLWADLGWEKPKNELEGGC